MLSGTALAIGLWSSGHCLAMCGGLALAAGQQGRHSLRHPAGQAIQMLGWQAGRVLSYGLMGALAGAMGAFFLSLGMVEQTQRAGMVVANLLLIGLGLHLARVSSLILFLEEIGRPIWRVLAPWATATLTPAQPAGVFPPPPLLPSLAKALRAGALWGWLPCGLVYSMVITASVTGSPASGAGWMVSFGLGTIPALWAASMAGGRIAGMLRADGVRRGMGWLIIAFGVWGLLRALEWVSLPWLDAFCITPA